MRNFVSAGLVLSCASLVAARHAAAVAPGDACGLLTKGEIDAAMSTPMGNGRAITAKACQWRQPVKQGDPGAIVDVTIINAQRYNIGKAIAGSSRF